MPGNHYQRPRCLNCLLLGFLGMTTVGAQTLYQFGNPTAEEQSYIELINRARANPPAEGARLAATTDADVQGAYNYFSVNTATMQSEFNAIAAAPPLAPNSSLTTSARGHSQWMLANVSQSHDETNPANTPSSRMTAAGYDGWSYGENISYASKSVWFGHASFEVDWGSGTGGMQTGRGHRVTLHNPDYHEIGVGIVNGTNGAAGPQVVTQDLGEPFYGDTFGTGVAYYDFNGNNFYDIGEGIGGLTVNVSGADRYCTTASGGGWAVPIPTAAATRTVTFSGLGINQTRSLVVPASTNAKVDLKLAYTPPTITSAANSVAGNLLTFTFTPVNGATGYRWKRWDTTAAAMENCDALTNVTPATTGGYPVVNTKVKQEGTGSFHLANPASSASTQILALNALYHGRSSSSALTFQSRLRNATGDEHCRVQIKEEGGSIWQEVYRQDGGTAESVFSAKTISLAGMNGKDFRVRFVFDFFSGSTWGTAADNFGWFIDAISFNDCATLTNNVSQTLAGTSGSFTPAAGVYQLSVAPINSGVEYPRTVQEFTATAPAPSFSTWAASIESANSMAPGSISGNPTGDPDKDGRANLVEYAFGTSPVSAEETASRIPALQPGSGDFTIRYVRDTGLTDLTLVPVASADFATWKAPGESEAPAGFTDTVISTEGNLETHEAKIPYGSGGHWFLRVKVSRP